MDQQVMFTALRQAELVAMSPDDRPLAPHEVRLRTLYTAVSSGTETAIYQGHHGRPFPCGTGYAAVGVITEIGAEVTERHVGQVVFAVAGHCARHRLPAELTVPVPAGLAPEEAVFVRLMGVTMSTLVTTTARPPGKVVVTGLGIVGLLGAQIFQACGYEVHAVDPDEARRATAAELGLSRLYADPPLADPPLAGQVDLVLECSGHEAAALAGCRLVRKRGEVVLVGVPWQRGTELYAHDLLHAIFHHYAVVRSGWEWEVPQQPTDFQTGSLYANYAAGLQWLAAGKVRVEGLFSLMSPADCQAAYEGLCDRRLPRPAVVFDWGQVPR